MKTKYSVLQSRYQEKLKEIETLDREINDLWRTPCGLKCSGCGEELATEAHFAMHFVLKNDIHLNLGECPKKLIERDSNVVIAQYKDGLLMIGELIQELIEIQTMYNVEDL